ncbi:PTS sugar transporter subunit IIB [Clostridium gasigenes]|uniref:PTS sugar transporter subunit IIB n=1 Tax=Clostridium gasigenes TaxID=94869 RepID=A0A1H0UXM9_9CLOT|nr:PTS sugar transporter subunit IIB [Clostridium gasigenes]MBB6624077.1 PTS sugar transporter subunit IIB [Clostridium gasigenes]MBB6714137.1 PTS sugar transporter subunit IIB [Clostridium gasigenes]MBU3088302.1 PTS sugar transporter subunit IIB [Clostridium gasigenes]MBU3103351.1 PTS sugar transporter subunit IIB [Clostridium gasigenes]MBU3109699.1 PTS sugar transporter subunit IIB [Clostridium gasigenes]
MLKVIAACGNGMGSSQIIKMKIAKIFKKLEIEVSIHHTSIGEAKSQASGYDVVFCSEALKSNFKRAEDGGTIVIGLKNLLSEQEIEQKIVEHIVNKK